MLEDKDWKFINNLIYRLYRTADLGSFYSALLEGIRLVIPYTEGRVYRMQRIAGNPVPTGGLKINKCGELVTLKEGEAIDSFSPKEGFFWVDYLYAAHAQCFRNSDIPDRFEEFTKTEMFKIRYESQNIYHAIKTVLIYNDELLGVFTLFRPKNAQDFSDRDVEICEALMNHISFKLWQLLNASEAVSKAIDTSTKASNAVAMEYQLTKRETEILTYLLNEESDDVICDKCFISHSTLKKHIYNIYCKTKVKNRMQLKQLAFSK